jgi:hypothetical protein
MSLPLQLCSSLTQQALLCSSSGGDESLVKITRLRDAQYVDFGSVQRAVRVQYAVRCLVRCLYAAVKGTCNVLVKVSLEVTY